MTAENDETLDIELNRLQTEVDTLVPFNLAPNDPEFEGIMVKIEPIFGLADNKAENAKFGNTSQWRCPKCGKLPREFKACKQDECGEPDCFTPQSLYDLTFTVLHIGPRVGEYFIRLACLIYVFGMLGGNTCGEKHPLYWKFCQKKEEIKDYYLNRDGDKTPVVLYRAKEGVAGNSNCGNSFK